MTEETSHKKNTKPEIIYQFEREFHLKLKKLRIKNSLRTHDLQLQNIQHTIIALRHKWSIQPLVESFQVQISNKNGLLQHPANRLERQSQAQ